MASTETELFKDKIEVSLDGRQIFYLFFGGAVIATLVFVLGVMVGRRVESRSVAEAGSPARDPLAALDRLEGSNELAFPSALRGDDVTLGSVDANLAGRLKLTKENMATGGPEPVDQEKKVAEAAAKKAAAAKAAVDKAAQAKVKTSVTAKKDEKKEASAKATRNEKKDAKAAKPSEEAKPAPKAKRRRFTLQVGSFQDKEEADTFFRGLSGGTYDPYMVEADVPGKGKYFRVRVGSYETFDEAVLAKSTFEGSQHVIAYVTRLK